MQDTYYWIALQEFNKANAYFPVYAKADNQSETYSYAPFPTTANSWTNAFGVCAGGYEYGSEGLIPSKIFLGVNEVAKIYVGSSEVTAVYLGSEKVFG